MRVSFIAAGAAGMYCGTCLHDNTLAAALIEKGHEVALTPTYTPMRTDEKSVAQKRVFFGALNVYLQQKMALFRHTPRLLDRVFDSPRLLNLISKLSGSTDARMLGELTVSMLEGEKGHQAKELDKLVAWLRDIIQPDLVHLSFTLFAGFARQIKKELGVPVVCSLQGEDLFFDELIEPYKSRILGILAERLPEIDAFISPCDYYSELMSAAYHVPRDRVYRSRLGINLQGFGDAQARPERAGPVVIGYLARQAPEKGLHLMIEAFGRLIERLGRDSARLRIAGFLSPKDRDYVAALRRRVADQGLEPLVDWVGEVDRQGKFDFLADLDLFSVPTVYREPKGIFVAEALATGVPVVLPAHGAFPEWLERTGGGRLCRPDSAEDLADQLAQLIANPAERRHLGSTGRAAIHRDFNHEVMADEMVAIYRQVLESSNPPTYPS